MFLNRLLEYAKTDRIAYVYTKDSIKSEYKYRDLCRESDFLASYFKRELDNKSPIVVFGHKSHLMLTAFLAAVKSGRPYCPIDKGTPENRVRTIIEKINPSCIICLDEAEIEGYDKILTSDVLKILEEEKNTISTDDYVKPEDLYYIIYTSGSTGNPKGVMISYENLNNFIDWAIKLTDCSDAVFLNQAPFSFDLSVMDLYMALGTGSTIYPIEKTVQEDYKKLFEELGKSNADIWVSTPSFADLCLADRSFNEELMPNLGTFLFCGEVLTNKTCKKLRKRFPNSVIINTYGPTESTVAVTSIEITDDIINEYEPLPIGNPKPGTDIIFVNDDGEIIEKEVESGELLIIGNTVSCGYYKEEILTSGAFKDIVYRGDSVRAYHTGDLGYRSNGNYFCSGRKDNQIKMHGYRIELGDIEVNLSQLEKVEQCAVIPHYVGGKVQRLTAYVVYREKIEDPMETTAKLKKSLSEYLLPYMIPQRFVYLDSLPMNNNGKIDRRALSEIKA